MSALPTINLPAAVTTPAIASQTISAAFISSLNIQPNVDPSRPWPLVATMNGLTPDGTAYAVDPSTGNVISQQVNRDLRADSQTFPLVGETLVEVMEIIEALGSISIVESQIGTQLAAITNFTQQINDLTAQIDLMTDPDAIAAAQATLASLQTTLQALQSSAWVFLLGQWRTIATTLGVTDPNALPPIMVGLVPPQTLA